MTPANRGKRLTKTFAAPVVVAVVRQGAAGRLWKVGDQVDKHEVVFASRSVGPHRGVSILDRAPGRSRSGRADRRMGRRMSLPRPRGPGPAARITLVPDTYLEHTDHDLPALTV